MLQNYELVSREITADRVTDSAIHKKNPAGDQVSHSQKCKYYTEGLVNLFANFFNIVSM